MAPSATRDRTILMRALTFQGVVGRPSALITCAAISPTARPLVRPTGSVNQYLTGSAVRVECRCPER